MELNERETQRVARYLDGELVDLTAGEQAVADDIRRREAILLEVPDIPVPSHAMHQARRRMMGELARPQRRTKWITWAGAGAAVAAAVLIVAVWVWRPDSQRPRFEVTPEALALAYENPAGDLDLDLIEEELEGLQADVLVSLHPEPVESEIETLQEMLDTFWLPDTDDFLEEG
ncbi:MAG: hypothetical protein ACYSTL_06250 [Planctomycetota bacterium]|jgi:hypothetical protein